jgi:hypothetical protein
MRLVCNDDFGERFAVRRVEDAAIEIDLESALHDTFVERGLDCVLDVLRRCRQRQRRRIAASLCSKISILIRRA